MASNMKTVTIKINHRSSIQGAVWCEPVGWEPANEIEGAEFLDGSWWGLQEEEAGLVYFGDDAEEGEVIDASVEDIRVAATGNCRVIADLKL